MWAAAVNAQDRQSQKWASEGWETLSGDVSDEKRNGGARYHTTDVDKQNVPINCPLIVRPPFNHGSRSWKHGTRPSTRNRKILGFLHVISAAISPFSMGGRSAWTWRSASARSIARGRISGPGYAAIRNGYGVGSARRVAVVIEMQSKRSLS